MAEKTSREGIRLSIFANRIASICDEMGVMLKRTAFSPNIRDRLDYSCAIFDAAGRLCAQAAHIPVHLGSMAYAMADIVQTVEWQAGDMLVLNDPYRGGTHLPDVTLVAPVFVDGECCAYAVNRAHHADIGAETPGSMPVSRSLHEEGVLIAPTKLVKQGVIDQTVLAGILKTTRQPDQAKGDFSAQMSANLRGGLLTRQLIGQMGHAAFAEQLAALNVYAADLAAATLMKIPNGTYCFEDFMDDDGVGTQHIKISLKLKITDGQVVADFSGTSPQVAGNINCPMSVTAAAVFYVFRCLMPDYTPACAGAFSGITLQAPPGCLLNARFPAAVTAGNVETSTRIVDVVMGALAQAVPEQLAAASHGSMNNLAMGGEVPRPWDYYETIGGGMGASPLGRGLDGVQTHMTNTLNTPIEVLETHYPIRVSHYALRQGSSGSGKHPGGMGLIREMTFLAPATVTLITERRSYRPWGLQGGDAGLAGINCLNNCVLPAKCTLTIEPGDVLRVETAGGGGWGAAQNG